MKKGLFVVSIVMLLLAMVMPAFGAGQTKSDVCHLDDDGNYMLINIADPAVDAHIEHGDSVAGTNGLDENCDPVPDADGDGVPDEIDSCPDLGDLGYGVDEFGCPYPPPPPPETCTVTDYASPVETKTYEVPQNGFVADGTKYYTTSGTGEYIAYEGSVWLQYRDFGLGNLYPHPVNPLANTNCNLPGLAPI